ncbi:MAG: N-acetylmuramoyl-L-alanine amidase [Myxococcota bacterium]
MRDPAARWLPSPNFAPGRQGACVRTLIVHGTFSVTEARSLDYLLRSKRPHRVSSHYLITYAGELLQLVSEADTAWHAGRSAWGDDVALNRLSVGVEISNRGPHEAYGEVQLVALEGLLGRLQERFALGAESVLGHSDVAPGRKDDPGAHFPWRRLEGAGLAAAWRPGGVGVEPLVALRAGGGRGEDAEIVRAFQRRYLPEGVSGRLDARTRARICGG